MNNFDIIYYINLDHRVDRNDHIINTLKNAEVESCKIRRISAVYDSIMPHLGCAKSHLKCLDDFEKSEYKNCLVLEDDFILNNNVSAKDALNNLFKHNIAWDVMMISGFTRNITRSTINYLAKVTEAQTASGYAVNKPFIHKIRNNIIECINRLTLNNHPDLYAVDQYWKKLQPNNNWYIFYPKLGYQIDNYSDIEKKQVSYLDKKEEQIPYRYKFVLGILTCKQNLSKANEQYEKYLYDIDKYPIIYIKFYGDPNIEKDWIYDEKTNTLVIKCEDDYVNLPHKVYLFLKIARTLFPDVLGVFKTDDDIVIYLQNLYDLLEKNQDIPYYGRYVSFKSEQLSSYLADKKHVINNYAEFQRFPVYLEKGSYCSGGGYYLRNDAIDIILKNNERFHAFPKETYMNYLIDNRYFRHLNVFEDKSIGETLCVNGFYPMDQRSELTKAIHWDGI